MNNQLGEWGPWKPWDATMATEPPTDVWDGAWVETDLIIRADAQRYWPERKITAPSIMRQIWQVKDGQSFVYEVFADVVPTHIVMSQYRVWQGKGRPGLIEKRSRPKRDETPSKPSGDPVKEVCHEEA